MPITGSSRGVARGKVSLVLDLYRSGLPVGEIALRVYGKDCRRTRQRVHSIINLYGKRLGLLSKGETVRDDARGETIDSEGLVVREREVGESFITHSRPINHSNPFLGAYRSIRQLKASLSREGVRAVNTMSYVDRFLGPLNLPHESVVREEAMLLARKYAGKGGVKEVAAAAAFTAVLKLRPGDLAFLIEVLDSVGVKVLNISLLADMLR